MDVVTELSPGCKKEVPGQCFVGAEKSDVLWHGRKIDGAAQRRTKAGLLVQGSVQPPPLKLTREDWEKAMCDVAREKFRVTWAEWSLEAKVEKAAAILVEQKYSQSNYNQKR